MGDVGKVNEFSAVGMEYLTAEFLELVGDAACDDRKTKIIHRHIQFAARIDEELNKSQGGVTIVSGDVLPNIHRELVPKKRSKDKGELQEV